MLSTQTFKYRSTLYTGTITLIKGEPIITS